MRELDPDERQALLTSRLNRYVQRHANDDAEKKAQGQIAGLLNAWREAMGDRDGIMRSADGSDLREDELRVAKLPLIQRSVSTQDDPLEGISSAARADHAIGNYHNLMMGLDAMIFNEDRDVVRLHLTSEFVIIRALIESATTALFLLGPDSSDERVLNALRLKFTELEFSQRLGKNYAELSGQLSGEEYKAQEEFVSGQLSDLRQTSNNAKIRFADVAKSIGPMAIAVKAGGYVPELGSALTYWYWSTASSLAHGELGNTRSLTDLKFIGVDTRDEPVGYMEPSAASIYKHLFAAHQLIARAHVFWNDRARTRRP